MGLLNSDLRQSYIPANNEARNLCTFLLTDTNAPAPGPDPINSNPAAPGQDQEKKLDCGNGVYTCTSSVCSYYTGEEDNKECKKEQQCCPSGCCTGSSCQGPCL